jgi:hypothetical protein
LKVLKESFDKGRKAMGNDYDYYNLVEKCIIEVELKPSDKKKA